jgi:glucose-6-phosphate 1-dehydrogenase
VDPISEVWRENKAPLANYVAGSWGPREADELLERDGRYWRKP